MMNLLQVQDDLKNFSQDQLVKEMQQPSGSAPQFLVLSELNRRKRVKGDFEARQAQQQPTVAEEAVASAGVPQNQMMGMPEAMAPQSAVSDGVGTSAPMKMASGGLMQFGNDIRSSMSQQIDPYLEEVENEAEAKFNIDLDQGMQGGAIQLPGPRIPTFPRPSDYNRPFPQPSIGVGIGGKGFARPSVLERGPQFSGIPAREQLLSVPYASPARGYAEGGVIRAADGLPEEDKKFGDDFVDYVAESFPAALENLDTLGGYLNPFNYFGSDSDEEKQTEQIEDVEGIDQALNEAPKMPEQKPEQKLNLTSDEKKPLTLEQELLKRQEALEKDRNFDKYMALAQAGLGILASEKPTLAQAIGEGGQSGLTAYAAANERYKEGLNDILNARSKLQQAKIKAAGKGVLDRKGALSALSSYNNDISAVRKQIGDIQKAALGSPTPDQQKQIAALQKELNRLRFEQSQLYGEAGIRQRPTVNVASLPSTKKGE